MYPNNLKRAEWYLLKKIVSYNKPYPASSSLLENLENQGLIEIVNQNPFMWVATDAGKQLVSSVITTYTKTFTPAAWFEFQKQDAVIEVINSVTAVKLPDYKEIRVTFVWDASKAN